MSRQTVLDDRTSEVEAQLRNLAASSAWGTLTWHRPGPSAAFSRRDTRAPGFADAADGLHRRGFRPFIRPVGGHLAVYDHGALVMEIRARCVDPREGTTGRFREVAGALAQGLRTLGVPADVGEVPGEYCPGRWSVHAGGSIKLAGTGQRLGRGAAFVTAVVVVGDPEPSRAAMAEAYPLLGLDLDPATVGSVGECVPGIEVPDVQQAIEGALGRVLALGPPDRAVGRALRTGWDPR